MSACLPLDDTTTAGRGAVRNAELQHSGEASAMHNQTFFKVIACTVEDSSPSC
jgi:hypothetical protein